MHSVVLLQDRQLSAHFVQGVDPAPEWKYPSAQVMHFPVSWTHLLHPGYKSLGSLHVPSCALQWASLHAVHFPGPVQRSQVGSHGLQYPPSRYAPEAHLVHAPAPVHSRHHFIAVAHSTHMLPVR